jgi:hypothetical protein
MSVYAGPEIVNDGLVLCLDAANPKSYPGSGTTWFDVSGRNNHGTMTSVTYNSSNNGTMIYDAGTDNVLVAHNSDFNFNSVMSISTWIKVTSFNTSTIYNIVSKKPSFNNTQVGWSCQYDYRTTGVLQFRNNNGTVLNDSTPTANINNTSLMNQTDTYVNCVWTISGTSIVFYINGLNRGTGTAAYTNTDSSTPIYIGKTVGSTFGDNAILSNLSSVSIYNRALTASEVQQNFNATRSRYDL